MRFGITNLRKPDLHITRRKVVKWCLVSLGVFTCSILASIVMIFVITKGIFNRIFVFINFFKSQYGLRNFEVMEVLIAYYAIFYAG